MRLVERVTKGVTGLDDNSNREVKSLRVLGEVKMMSLKSIYQTVELNGIPVTLLGVQNDVALFIDIDGNEIEVAVNCELETLGFELDSRMLARCEDRDNQADKV